MKALEANEEYRILGAAQLAGAAPGELASVWGPLRRLRDSVRPYPIRRVDPDLFGARR